jgi:hypothetical protein
MYNIDKSTKQQTCLETAAEAENEANKAVAASDYGTGGAQHLIIQIIIIIVYA